MRIASATVGLLTSASLLASGCAHDQIGWPPTSADVARINESAAANDWLRVEYVEPLATRHGLSVAQPVEIVPLKPDQIGFRTRAGEIQSVPLDLVTGVTVKERAPGAAIGALIGLGIAALFIGGAYLASRGLSGDGFPDSSVPDERRPCDAACVAKAVAPALAAPTVAGAIVGWLVGYQHTFDLEPAR